MSISQVTLCLTLFHPPHTTVDLPFYSVMLRFTICSGQGHSK